MNKYQKCMTPDFGLVPRISLGGFLSACVALLLLLTPVAKVEAAHGELRDQFDTIAGKGLPVESAELKWLQRQEVTFLFDCSGERFEYIADVDGPRAEVILKDKDVTKAGICHVHIEHKGEDVDAFYFEVFADVTMKKEIVQATKEDLFKGERAEFKAGAFDKFGNSTIDSFVIVSGDGPIEEGETDAAGYRHFFFTPEEMGIATIELVEPNAGPGGRTKFTFEVLDPNPPPAAAPAQGRGDAVTLLLGQLIRASLLDEYGSAPPAGETTGDQGYSLVDSFDVEIGDSESTLHVNEQYDLSITALDRRGKRVQNYVDRVIVETSDPDAIVPSGTIRFKATDRGQKVLSLAIMFQTPGQQSVTIRDEADPEEIFGKASVWVLGQTSAPTNRSITLNEKSGTVRGSKASISGMAPAYTNLQLFTVEADGTDRELAMTASDADGKFRFEIALEGGIAHTLFVRDPEERVKDSETITLTVDATMPVLRSAVLTPSVVSPGASFTVSVVAETGHRAYAALPQGTKTELQRKRPSEETGFDVYESTLNAPAIAGTHAVTITIADSAGNETAETRMLAVATEATGFPIVENLQATVQNQDVLLSWSPVSGAIRYRVYFGSAASNMERFVETKGATTSIRLTGLTGGQATFFAVTALGSGGEESVQKSAVVSAMPRGSLFELTAFPQMNGAVLRWIAPPGTDIAAYRIRYGVQPNLPTEERMVPVNMLEYGVRDLINGATYYFALEAVRTNGELLKDTMEVSATPGQNGMPGVAISPLDPLPEGIGGPGAGTVIPRDSSHGAAPSHVPESGSSLLVWLILFVAGCGGFFGLRSFRMWKLEREFLVSFQR